MTNLPKLYRINLPSDDPVIVDFVQSQRHGLPVAISLLIHDFIGRFGSTDALALLSQQRHPTVPAQPTPEPVSYPTYPAPEPKLKKASKKKAESVKEKVEEAQSVPDKKESAPVSETPADIPTSTSDVLEEETTESLLGLSWS